LTQRQLVVRM